MPAVDDLKNLNRLDQVALGAGVLGLIVSLFFPFYGSSVKGFGGGSINAWHSYAAFGMLLVLIGTVAVAARLFAAAAIPKMPVGINLLTVALLGLGTILVIIRGFSYPSGSGGGYSYGVKWGGYLLYIILIAETVASFLVFKASGEKLPDFQAMQANRTAGAVPPPPGYGTTPTPPAATYPPAPTTPAGDFTLDDTNPPAH